MRNTWGNDASSIRRMPKKYECMRKEYRWDDEHFPLVPSIHSFPFIQPFSMELFIDWEDVLQDEWVFILQIYVLPFLWRREQHSCGLYLEMYSKSTFQACFLFPLYLLNQAVRQPGRTVMCMRRAEKAYVHLTFPFKYICLFDFPGGCIYQHNPSQVRNVSLKSVLIQLLRPASSARNILHFNKNPLLRKEHLRLTSHHLAPAHNHYFRMSYWAALQV